MLSFLKKHRRIIITTFLVVVLLINPLGANTAHALNLCSTAVEIATGGIAWAICAITQTVLSIPMVLAAFFLWMSGLLLNYVMDYTVVGLKGNLDALTGIKVAWGAIRDLMNISFIFVLLYTAIGTILGISKADWKKTVGSVIIAAILINFSIFFTKVLIDASNIVTYTFYRLIVPDTAIFTGVGLSDQIMKPLGLGSFYNVGDSGVLSQFGIIDSAIVSIGGALFMGIAAFSFIAVAIMFIIRYVTIIFLLILSPIAVMGAVIPKLGEQAKKWWGALSQQLLFAPTYMIMIWVVLIVINFTAGPTGSAAKFTDLFGSLAKQQGTGFFKETFALVFTYIVVIGLIYGALIIAQSISKTGAKAANAMAGGMIFGTSGFAGRKSLGFLGRKVADSDRLKEASVKGGIIRSNLAKSTLLAGKKSASGSFDFRGTNLGSTFGKNIDGGIGKAGGKGGYDAYIKDEAKKKEEFAKSLDVSDIKKDAAKRHLEDLEEKRNRGLATEAEVTAARAEHYRLSGLDKKGVDERKKEVKEEMEKELKTVSNAGVKTAETISKSIEKELNDKKAEITSAVTDFEKDTKGKELEAIQTRLNEATEKTLAEMAKFEAQRQTIQDRYNRQIDDVKKVTSVGKTRTDSYVQSLVKEERNSLGGVPLPTGNRILGYGPIKQTYKQAAANIRKGKKPTKDILEEVLREQGDIPEKPAEEEKQPPSGGAPSTS